MAMCYLEIRLPVGAAAVYREVKLWGSDPLAMLAHMRLVCGSMPDFSSVELRRTKKGRVTGRIRDREGRIVYRIEKRRWNKKMVI